MKCESVITLKEDDNMGRYYLKNWHENPSKDLQKRTANLGGNSCYMYCCFQLLSWSFKNLAPPRVLTEKMIKDHNYGDFSATQI